MASTIMVSTSVSVLKLDLGSYFFGVSKIAFKKSIWVPDVFCLVYFPYALYSHKMQLILQSGHQPGCGPIQDHAASWAGASCCVSAISSYYLGLLH